MRVESLHTASPGTIDPGRMTDGIRQKLTREYGREWKSDKEAALPIYRARWWGPSRKWGDGVPAFLLEVLGCNEDCAHCYVPTPLLRADTYSDTFKKRLAELPQGLQVFPQRVDILFEYVKKRYQKKLGTHIGGVIELTGGEPTIYPEAIKRLAVLAKENEMTVGVNTDGFLIAHEPETIISLDGFQNTLKYLVSLKGTTPEAFATFTGAKEKFWETPFLAARIMKGLGFDYHLGITADTIASPQTAGEDIDRLMSLLETYGLDSGKIVWDKITEQIRGNQLPTIKKMIARGYYAISDDGSLERHTAYKEVRAYLKEQYGVNI